MVFDTGRHGLTKGVRDGEVGFVVIRGAVVTVILFVGMNCMLLLGKTLWARQTGPFTVSYG